jgi:REP element-mobilizing transposase RayT
VIPADTYATRGYLPHLEKNGKTYFVTFATWKRAPLQPEARSITLEVIVRDHRNAYWLHSAVVMPDHVHIVLTPYEEWRLPQVMQRIKSVSAHLVNRALRRHGVLWQDESFDRILRSEEDIRRKCEYVCENPVRAGLVDHVDEYQWIWREWVEGTRTGEGACPPTGETVESPG